MGFSNVMRKMEIFACQLNLWRTNVVSDAKVLPHCSEIVFFCGCSNVIKIAKAKYTVAYFQPSNKEIVHTKK